MCPLCCLLDSICCRFLNVASLSPFCAVDPTLDLALALAAIPLGDGGPPPRKISVWPRSIKNLLED